MFECGQQDTNQTVDLGGTNKGHDVISMKPREKVFNSLVKKSIYERLIPSMNGL